jgi:hypothetical protein
MASLNDGGSLKLDDCLMRGNYSLRFDELQFEGCKFTGGVTLSPINSGAFQAKIMNCTAKGLYVNGPCSGSINCNSINGTISDSLYGLTILYAENMTITGNAGIESNNQLMVNDADGCTISGNTFRDLRIADASNCAIIGNVSTSTTAANAMSGVNCTVLGNANMYNTGSYSFTNSLPANPNLNLYNV